LMEGGPIDLVLVRHGESEGNLAQDRSRRGVESDWQSDFSERHSSRYRLTDKGRTQANASGEFIKENIYPHFDRYYTSEYVRAMETAALLGFDHADWFVEFNLREKDNGILGSLSQNQRTGEYAKELARRDRDIFYFEPPGGESISTMCGRVDRFLKSLERDCAGLRVIVVCHGNIMEGFRLLLEGITQFQWLKLKESKNPYDHIHNCQIFWYSRRAPTNYKVHYKVSYVKRICPWKPEKSKNEWERIDRPLFTAKDLLKVVHSIPQLVNNSPIDVQDTKDTTSDTSEPEGNAFLLNP